MNNAKKLTLKFRAKTFYFASVFLPNKIRKDIENLYIFCRYVDDIGDGGNFTKKNAIKKLSQIKSQILKVMRPATLPMRIPRDIEEH